MASNKQECYNGDNFVSIDGCISEKIRPNNNLYAEIHCKLSNCVKIGTDKT